MGMYPGRGSSAEPGSDESTLAMLDPHAYTLGGYGSLLDPEDPVHTTRDKEKLIARVRRIRGQVEAIEKSIASEDECSKVLMTVAACRGALTALTSEILEDHIRFHVLDPEARPNSKRARAAEDLIDVVRAYLK